MGEALITRRGGEGGGVFKITKLSPSEFDWITASTKVWTPSEGVLPESKKIAFFVVKTNYTPTAAQDFQWVFMTVRYNYAKHLPAFLDLNCYGGNISMATLTISWNERNNRFQESAGSVSFGSPVEAYRIELK